MSNLFTLKSIPINAELGMTLKNFRIENEVTAKSITEKFGKASSYISKLEKGIVKKIDGEFLIDICNFISGNDNGLKSFLTLLSSKYRDFSDETKLIIMNIDDLLYEHTIPKLLITDLSKYMNDHNISIYDLVSKINSNDDIQKVPNYDSLPENQWLNIGGDIDRTIIKLSVPESYIDSLLKENETGIHLVIAEAIFYALFRLGNEDTPHLAANNKLISYNIYPVRSAVDANKKKIDELLNGLEPDTVDSLKDVYKGLKFITSITKGYGAKCIKQINQNMHEDLGFCFAFMSMDITDLSKQDKEKKQAFLNELKAMINRYSQNDTSIETYDI